MSYDLVFTRRSPGQPWDEALEAMEEASLEAGQMPEEMLQAWARIAARAAEILGDEIEETVGSDACELTDLTTGIRVSMLADQAGIGVPWGDEDADLLDLAYQVGAVIEEETTLEGYDPQAAVAIAEVRP